MQIREMYAKSHTPFRPIYSAIWPLAIAPTIAPTFANEPNTENYNISTKISKRKKHIFD
jgi:hypothetical protein